MPTKTKSYIIWGVSGFLCFYSIYELQKISSDGYKAISWHTHLMFPFLVCFIAYLFLQLLGDKFKHKIIQTGKRLLFSFFILWFLLETALLITGINKTHFEKNNRFYTSPYAVDPLNYYRTFSPNVDLEDTQEEFHFSRKTNSLGYPDIEWNIEKDSGEYRVLCIGDSFTEGIGAHKNSCYIHILKDSLSKIYKHTTTMNAGVSGSDPYFGYINYRDRLSKYKPDIVIQTLSSNDIIDDIYVRGGMERFQENKTIKYKKSSRWENLYAISYVSRIFFRMMGYEYQFTKSHISVDEKKQINQALISLCSTYALECKKNGAELYIVLLPMCYEVINKKYNYDLETLIPSLKKNTHTINLMPFYINTIYQRNDAAQEYYWPKDGHHNALGYQLMAEGIYSEIKENTPSY